MLMMAAIAIGLDHISIGIVVKLIAIYIVKPIAISLDRVLMDVDGGLTVGLTVGSTVGLTVGSTWLCWAINLSEAFDSSDDRLLRLSAKRV
jgi:hypothetical protein